MNNILALFKRNVILFFRHKKSLMLSFVSVFMLLLIYILFLGSQHVTTIEHSLEQYNLTADKSDIYWLVNCWVLGGLLSMVPFTAARTMLGQMVTDHEDKIIRDFKSSPLKIWKYPISMICSATIVGIMMACAVMAVICTYISITSRHMFPVTVLLKVIGIVGIHSFMCACIMSYPVSKMRTNQDYSTMCTVVDMLIGFVNCVYIPIGVLPESVQNCLRFLPFNQATELLRHTICKEPMQHIFTGLAAEGRQYYENYEGVSIKFGNMYVHYWVILLHMLLWAALFFFLFVRSFKQKDEHIG